jgi:hypothetical protein
MKRSWQIFWHAFFWIVMVAFCVIVADDDSKLSTNDILVLFVLYPLINISLFYINYLVLIPRFLNNKRYSIYAASIVILLIAFGFGKYGVALIFKQYVLMRYKGHFIGFGQYFTGTIFTSLVFLFLSTALKFTVDWFINERIQRDLENQRLSAELAFLKSQINPHFLFNSLNSIYSLA